MLFQRQNAEVVTLGSTLGVGGEGSVYPIAEDQYLVAKVYHQITDERIYKLAAMLANPPDDPMAGKHTSIAWPVDLLFTTDSNPHVVGYLMPRVSDMRPVFDFYNPKTRRQHCPHFNYSYLYRAGRNLASAVHALHTRGYVIGDVNESNILVSDTTLVTLVDTDSFQVPDAKHNCIWRCPVGKAEFTPPELQGRKFADVDRMPEHDLFGLGVMIFQMLMEGQHPFAGKFQGLGDPPPVEQRISSGHFPHGRNGNAPYDPPPSGLPFATLNPSLQQLFRQCFVDGHRNPKARPDAQTWRYALQGAEDSMKRCSTNDQHFYSGHLGECPWCFRASQLGGRDAFPSVDAVRRGDHLRPPPRRAPSSHTIQSSSGNVPPLVQTRPPSSAGIPTVVRTPPSPLQRQKASIGKILTAAAIALIVVVLVGRAVFRSGTKPPEPTADASQITKPTPESAGMNAEAMFKQGDNYCFGKGVAQDYAEAAKWYRKAAALGSAGAMDNLGNLYRDGQGVTQNYTESVKWYQKAAELGDAHAMCNLGNSYFTGQGVAHDYTEAAQWWRKAAELGNTNTMFNLGVLYSTGQGVTQDYTEAVKWYRKVADLGNADAMYNLGLLYDNGQGVEQDRAEAAKWCRKAADLGNAKAMATLGRLYGSGVIAAPDYAEAMKWFRKAAEQGDANGQLSLGYCYNNGWGVEKNLTEAVKWWRMAAEQGDAKAQLNLGTCYANGFGVEKNPTEAVKWFRKAAELGKATAQTQLGSCYYNGFGVEKNPTEAVEWFRKSAEQGDVGAFSGLGRCYLTGAGIEKNPTEAVKWFRKAAEQGDADGQFNLAACYYNGSGVEKNQSAAVAWCRKAAENGNADAIAFFRSTGNSPQQ